MTLAPAIDDRTASAIREAMVAARAGRIADAVRIGELALAGGGNAAALNAMIGSLHCQAGNLPAGIEHLRAARRERPDDPVIAFNLATALSELGDYRSALEVVPDELARADPSLRLLRMRAFFAQMIEDFPTAIAAYAQVVDAEPSDWETWNNLGNARVSSGDVTGGVAALRQAAQLNPLAAPTRLNYCRALRDAGELTEAESQLRAMADDFPDDAKPLMDLHDLLQAQGRADPEIVTTLERAIEREPGDVQLVLALGRQHFETFAMGEAEQAFRAVLQIEPANDEAFIGLMMVAEYSQPALLNDLVAEAEAAGASAAASNLLRAYAHRRARRFDEGLAALDAVPSDYEPARRRLIEGQLLDALRRYAPAFAAFKSMNDLLSQDTSQPLERAAQLRQRRQQDIELTTAEWIQRWAAPPIQSKRPAPVFLVGFPRSGTTLLDTMLMGHPGVEVMEERPVMTRLEHEIGGYQSIASLTEGQVEQAQERYFAIAREYADLNDGTLLVDKSPLLLSRAPLVHRLFPDARFILALRHPADVLLSCYTTSFRLNSAMANFLTLETAAEFYDLTFKAWENARALLPIQVEAVRYEHMVADPESELRPVVEALGLAWHADVVDHQRTAEARGIISTASYSQVTEPLYRRAVGRWNNYREQLDPILPVLRPWIRKFGYDLNDG